MLNCTNHFFESSNIKAEEKLFSQILGEMQSGYVGYYTLPDSQQALLRQIERFNARPWIADSLKDIVVIGIGGSSLGTKAVCDLLHRYSAKPHVNLHFLENVDPIYITSTLEKIALESTLFIMISKSGSTIETTSITKYVIERYGLLEEPERFSQHFAVITDEGSPLEQFAALYNLETFTIPTNVGGRFSILSAVGLVPLYLAGYDIHALLEGAKMMKESFFGRKQSELLDKALFYANHASQFPINVLFSYGSEFDAFNKWYVQLWGESLGKRNSYDARVGLTPVGLTGSVDQHSFLQLIMEGPRNKTVTFIKTNDFESPLHIPNLSLPFLEKTDFVNGHLFSTLLNYECDATMQSIQNMHVPVDLIILEKLDAVNVGGLLYYYELLTSLAGLMLDIDTYNQPGVEIGKQLLKKEFNH